MRNLIDTLWGEWKTVEQQVEQPNDELERISVADAGCTRIRKLPGMGSVIATAIVAGIGNGAALRKGREFAAWLGIVSRQYSTGGKAKLFGISKRGNRYLHKILIHGARAAVLRIKREGISIGALAGSTGRQSSQKHRRSRDGKQALPYRMGGVVERQRVQANNRASLSKRGTDAFALETLRVPAFPHSDDDLRNSPPRSA